ncbi:hypothetical protein NQZ79_g8012 [Umbelopsis isabellina]|nr:hypothetical protein NQZ79_g8012 [Umbelopsis isabellina]
MLNANQGPTLTINAVAGRNLLDKDIVGKQDPYAQFSLDPTNPKAFQKTFTHKDAGKNANWNQSFVFPLHGESDLFVEVFDEDPTADEVIGFAAIPINQIVYAQGGSFYGAFEIYQINGKPAGEILLQLNVQGLPNTPQGQGGYGYQQQQPQRGQSYVNEVHAKRVKSLRNKGIATDVGIATLGGALAIGAGLLGQRLYDDHRKQEEHRRNESESMQHDRERYERERHQFDEEKARYEREHSHQNDYRREEEHHRHNEGHHGGQHGGQHGHGQHGNCRDWDPVGTYAAGDRVEYHGRTYVCLQGHSSNPTWMPDVAHSLWQTA